MVTATGAPPVRPHPSVDERRARGRAARRTCPRSAHGAWEPPADRPDPIALLEEQAAARVPHLVPIRHGRMAASAFAFFRGAAYIMASDLAREPRSGLEVQLCGDAHLSNFGVFSAPDRRLVFDLNDFDETLPGPFEWDVKRLAASLAVAGRARGFDDAVRRRIVRTAVERYRTTMRDFAERRNLEVWYARLDVEDLWDRLRADASGGARKRTERNLAKARRKDSLRALDRLAARENGEVRLRSDPPLLVPLRELVADAESETEARARALLRSYQSSLRTDLCRLLDGYRFVDLAHKVVGVGSVGTRAWVALFLGRDTDDPLFLQIKEAQASVLEPFLRRSAFRNHGRRVVEGQRLMQAASDVLLGWLHVDEGLDGRPRDFYVRQLWDGKLSAEVEVMSPQTLGTYAAMCGWTLARAHARSGDRVAIAAYLGGGSRFDEAIADFAEAYAEQNERDHAALLDAIAEGRLEARDDL